MSQTGVVSWSQTAASNATADSNVNWAEGMAPSQVNDSARAEMASVAKWRDDDAGTLISSGTSAAYTLTTNQSFSSLTVLSGQTVTFKATTANTTGVVTLSVDGLTAKEITINGTSLPGGFIRAGIPVRVTYDNSAGVFYLNNLSQNTFLPPGMIVPYAGSSAPSGWLLCDGTGYSRTSFASLFAAISTTYGSSDGSSFKVPDCTGRVIAGLEASATRLTTAVAGINGATLGAAGASQSGSIAQTHLPSGVSLSVAISSAQGSHTHGYSSGGSALAATGSGTITSAGGTAISVTSIANAVLPAMTGTADLGGSGTGFPVVQPTIVLNYIIKT